MTDRRQAVGRFRQLHEGVETFVIPNPWDIGSARLLANMGFAALATTSSGFAWSLGRTDGDVTRDEALAHCRQIAAATPLPVNADLEKCFADDPEGVSRTIRLASETGIAGASVEDFSGTAAAPIYGFGQAVERVAAAVEAAREVADPILITARAEGLLHQAGDLDDIIRRLQAFEAAGADVLYAPGLARMDDIRRVLAEVGRPVNVLVSSFNADLTFAELAAAGVRRISVGGALARASMGALIAAGQEIIGGGTFSYAKHAPAAKDLDRTMTGN